MCKLWTCSSWSDQRAENSWTNYKILPSCHVDVVHTDLQSWKCFSSDLSAKGHGRPQLSGLCGWRISVSSLKAAGLSVGSGAISLSYLRLRPRSSSHIPQLYQLLHSAVGYSQASWCVCTDRLCLQLYVKKDHRHSVRISRPQGDSERQLDTLGLNKVHELIEEVCCFEC